jgi:RecA-family ATPase
MTKIEYASEIEEVPQRSLWPGFIPEKNLTVLMGESGIGKSSVMREIVRRLTRGGEDMPDDWRNEDTQGTGVVWISNEEDTAGTLVPALRTCGADLSLIRIMSKIRPDVTKMNEPAERTFRADNPEDLTLLRQVIWENPDDNIGLIVVDSARGMADKSISHPKACRQVLEGLQGVAEDTSCVIVLLHHTNRSRSKNGIERTGGSAEMYNFPRCVIIVSKSDTDASKMTMAVDKPFLCAAPPSLTYQRESDGKVTFIKGILPDKVAEYEEADRQHLDSAIIAFLEASPGRGYQARQVAASCKRTYDAVAKQLQRLTDAGRIERLKYGVYSSLRQNVAVEVAPQAVSPTPTATSPGEPTIVLAPSDGTDDKTLVLAPSNGHSDHTVPMR